MRINLFEIYGPFLTRAQPARELCAQILSADADKVVTLDFTGIVQMSPSFANAMFFNLLHRMDIDQLRNKVRVENAAPHIVDAINAAISRKVENRAELTTYLIPA